MDTPDRVYRFTVDGQELETSSPTLHAEQIREMANLAHDRVLLIRGATPEADRRLGEHEALDLSAAGVEHLLTRSATAMVDVIRYRLQVDAQVYDRFSGTITASGIRRIAGLPEHTRVYQEPAHQLLAEAAGVDLTPVGTERFSTQATQGTVTVRAPNGAPVTLPYAPGETVATLAHQAIQAFQAEHQVEPGQDLILALDGRVLDAHATLAAAGISAGAVLNLRARGLPSDG